MTKSERPKEEGFLELEIQRIEARLLKAEPHTKQWEAEKHHYDMLTTNYLVIHGYNWKDRHSTRKGFIYNMKTLFRWRPR